MHTLSLFVSLVKRLRALCEEWVQQISNFREDYVIFAEPGAVGRWFGNGDDDVQGL